MTKLRAASMFVLVALLALVYAVGIAVAHKLDIPANLVLPASLAFAVLVVTLQYIIGPFLLDAVLSVRWADPRELGPEFATWHQRTCSTFKISEPRLGIIEDGMPNAFTYGHGGWNGRVIITRGLIDILDPEELKCVYAHELGHIKNGDFVMMTLVQALVLVLYTLMRGSRFGNSKNTFVVMLAAYAAYWVSYYISLLFSRLREYMADYASAQIVGNPNALCSALVKISYGLAQTHVPGTPQGNRQPIPPSRMPAPAPSYAGAPAFATAQSPDKALLIAASFQKPADQKAAMQQEKQRQATLHSLGAFGIASAASMRAAVSWYQPGGNHPDNFAQVARWELYNPWARIAELVSTHPLTAYRIRALQKMNRIFGLKDQFDFTKVQPAKYGAFARDLIVVALPILCLGVAIACVMLVLRHASPALKLLLPAIALLVGGLIKLVIEYSASSSGRRKVLQLLSEVQVSHVNPKYVIVEGTLTGRLESGMPWAKDFIVQDDTGYVACIYRQPFLAWEALFGFLTARTLIGRPVRIHGWYRRFNSPFLEIDRMEMLDTHEERKAYHFPWLVGLYVVGLVMLTIAMVLIK